MNKLDFIFDVWGELYNPNNDAQSVIERFFHEDYTQCINGVNMDRLQYINHAAEQKKNLEEMEFFCKDSLVQGNKLFVIYDVKGKSINDDDPVEAEVIASYEFKDDKILNIHGQVHLSQGKSADVDMDT